MAFLCLLCLAYGAWFTDQSQVGVFGRAERYGSPLRAEYPVPRLIANPGVDSWENLPDHTVHVRLV